MNIPGEADKHLFLNSGQLVVSSKDLPVVTILGSCVALTFYSPEKKTGAIFHALLPEHVKKYRIISNAPPVSPDPDYVDYAFYFILEKFREKGIDPGTLRLMLFGGGDVISALSSSGRMSIGFQNIKMVKKLVQNEGASLHGEDVGGEKGRKIMFMPHTGKVYLEYIKKGQDSDIQRTGKK